MALQSVGSGWEARPLQSKAAVSIATGALSATQVLDLAAKAASQVRDDTGWLKLGERSANKLTMSVRDMTREDTEPVLFFDIDVDRAVGRVTVRTAITQYSVKSGGIGGLVPMAKRKIAGFGAYYGFMEEYARVISAADPGAHVSFSGD